MSERRCDKCDYYEPGAYHDATTGECRRFPKAETKDGDYWCGEFRPAGEELIVPPTPPGYSGPPY